MDSIPAHCDQYATFLAEGADQLGRTHEAGRGNARTSEAGLRAKSAHDREPSVTRSVNARHLLGVTALHAHVPPSIAVKLRRERMQGRCGQKELAPMAKDGNMPAI